MCQNRNCYFDKAKKKLKLQKYKINTSSPFHCATKIIFVHCTKKNQTIKEKNKKK